MLTPPYCAPFYVYAIYPFLLFGMLSTVYSLHHLLRITRAATADDLQHRWFNIQQLDTVYNNGVRGLP